MRKKLLLVTFLAVPLLAITACTAPGGSGEDHNGSSPSASQSTGPDLSGIPDVVATVDGHSIKKSRFVEAYKTQYQQASRQAQQGGQKPDEKRLKKQVAESLVNTQLLVEEAGRRDFTASDKQVDAKLEELAKQYGADSADDLLDQLKKQGTDKSEVEEEIRNQVKIDQLIGDEAGNTTPTEKEVRDLYDRYVQQQKQQGGDNGQKVPSFDEAEPQIKQQLESQKKSEAANKLVTKLRKDATVKINL